jgi:hypothetical protein
MLAGLHVLDDRGTPRVAGGEEAGPGGRGWRD